MMVGIEEMASGLRSCMSEAEVLMVGGSCMSMVGWTDDRLTSLLGSFRYVNGASGYKRPCHVTWTTRRISEVCCSRFREKGVGG